MATIDIDATLNDNMLIIGAGEAGGRIAQEFSYQGFKKVVAVNTAESDLKGLDHIVDADKLLIPVGTSGGAGKDPNVVRNAIDSFYDDVVKFVREKAVKVEYVLVCIGGGGGTGGGLGIVLAQIIAEMGLSVGIVYTLPLMNESTLVFANSVDNLKEIHENAKNGAISPLIIVDNNKLVEEFTPTAANFWGPLNDAIVTVVKKFNEYSKKPSKFISALDSQDLKRLLTTGGVCAIGQFEVPEEFTEDMINKDISNHFFMDGFNLHSASACGAIVVGSEKTLQTSQSAKAINSVFDKVSGYLDGGMFFRGVYSDENVKYLRVYILFNGLALPSEHIDKMMSDVRKGYQKIKTQQNRFDDGIYANFGDGVGGMFNSQTGSKTIHRKAGVIINTNDDVPPSININVDRPSNPAQPPKPVENKPIDIPGMKRRER